MAEWAFPNVEIMESGVFYVTLDRCPSDIIVSFAARDGKSYTGVRNLEEPVSVPPAIILSALDHINAV